MMRVAGKVMLTALALLGLIALFAWGEATEPKPEKFEPPADLKKAIAAAPGKPETTAAKSEKKDEAGPRRNKEIPPKTDIEERRELVAPGDIISVFVSANSEFSRMVLVQPNGEISYPPLGEMPAAGFREDEVALKIAAGLSSYIRTPQVRATIKYVVGRPQSGEYQVKSGDVIEISVEGRDNYHQTVVVQASGKVLYQPLGEIAVAGQTPDDVTSVIQDQLSQILPAPKVNVIVKEALALEKPTAEALAERYKKVSRFGYGFFTGARSRLLKMEQNVSKPGTAATQTSPAKNAATGFIGPIDMMQSDVSINVPDKYILGPGDRLTIRLWSDVDVTIQTMPIVVGDEGDVIIPKAGKISVRGMTLAQFQDAARELMARVGYKNLTLIATLDSLKGVQIFITGEAFRPGSYAVSAVTTMFNALYMCGGPADNGSLRNISLLRNR